MVIYKKEQMNHFYTTRSKNPILQKHVYIHAKGYIETFYTDTYGNIHGLYKLVSRRTKLPIYETYYLDGIKIDIEHFYDIHGNKI
jgi:hypothetical protein